MHFTLTRNTLDAQNVGNFYQRAVFRTESDMNQPDELDYQIDTLAIRTGHTRSFEGEHGEPIFLTSSFVYANAEEAAAKFRVRFQVISTALHQPDSFHV